MRTEIQKLRPEELTDVQQKNAEDLAELTCRRITGATNRQEQIEGLLEMFKSPVFLNRAKNLLEATEQVQKEVSFHELCVDAHNREFTEAKLFYKATGN